MVQNKTSGVCALVKLRIRDDQKSKTVWQQLEQLQRLTRQEPGCLRFDFFEVLDEPQHLMLLEAFTDEAALVQHLEASYTQAYFALGLTDLVDKTELQTLETHAED